MSTKTVPTVYQQCTNRQNSQKIVKTAKMAIGVPIITCLHRVRRIHKALRTSIFCLLKTSVRLAARVGLFIFRQLYLKASDSYCMRFP